MSFSRKEGLDNEKGDKIQMQIKLNEEYRNLVPRLPKEDYKRLEKSIIKEGVRDPLIVNKDGIILDGYTRYEIAEKHNKKLKVPIVREFPDKLEEKKYVLRANLERRHLNQWQRGLLGLKFKDIETERIEKLKIEMGKQTGRGHKKVKEKFPEPLGQARDFAAKEVGISGRQLDKVGDIVEFATPEQKEKLNNGEESINAVYDQLKRERKFQERIAKRSALPEGKFNVIYADPPWQYDNKLVKWGAAELHYAAMSIEEICNYKDVTGTPIQDKFWDNAVLFLWATNPFLEDALEVVKAWGFEYKTNMVWVKTGLKRPGSGFYIRGRHELLFICIRGSFLPYQKGKEPIGSIIEADVGEHSTKPEVFYEIIEKMYSDCKYLELFARKKRPGWKSWGEEINNKKGEKR